MKEFETMLTWSDEFERALICFHPSICSHTCNFL